MIGIEDLLKAQEYGLKVDIKAGEFVVAEDGFLEIGSLPAPYTMVVDKMRGTFSAIIPPDDYRGRKYALKKNDCVTLVLEWLLRERGIPGLLEQYAKLNNRDFMMAYRQGQRSVIERFGFYEVEVPEAQPADTLLMGSHIMLYLGDGKMLHHLPSKLSCIDTVNWSVVTGVWRHEHGNSTN